MKHDLCINTLLNELLSLAAEMGTEADDLEKNNFGSPQRIKELAASMRLRTKILGVQINGLQRHIFESLGPATTPDPRAENSDENAG